jgi:predicted porin
MRKVIWLVLALSMLPTTARAQQAPAAQNEVLQRLVSDQARRLEALEARLAALQAEVKDLRSLSGLAPSPAVVAGAQPPTTEEPLVEHATGGEPPADPDAQGPSDDLPRARPIDAYGSLRVASAVDTDGRSEIRNNASRLGLRGEKSFGAEINVFARVEVGLNLVANDRVILQGGDPGGAIGQGSQAFTSRLGFVGLDSRIGSFSWGKQWSAYYDVAEFTDQFPLFGGAASGAWAAGTDGGIAGTGRAEKAFLYRHTAGSLSVALQGQTRASSPNARSWFDTWGAAVVFGPTEELSFGAAYNAVRDGVANPNPNQPQLGDEAALFGARYRDDRWYAAATFSILEQHEVDDLGRRFDGNGYELVLRRILGGRFWVEVGFNDLQPDSDHPGDYRVRFGLSYVGYNFGTASRAFAGARFQGSRNSDGSKLPAATFVAGLNYTF